MTSAPEDPVSRCLIDVEPGGKSAVNRRLPQIYDDLPALAKRHPRNSSSARSLLGPRVELQAKPPPRELPVLSHRAFRDLESLGSFFDGES